MICIGNKYRGAIHRVPGLLLLGALVLLMSGCASTVMETRSYRSQETGKEVSARVGSPMLISEQGTLEKVKRWVGYLNSPDGTETIATKYQADFKRKELIYLGSAGSVIKVSYREFGAGSAIPGKMQELSFDLGKSDLIEVNGFRIRVLSADTGSIRYVVMN